MFYDKIAFVFQLGPTASGADQEGYAPHPGFPNGIPINIQPATPEMTVIADGEAFKTFHAFVPPSASGVVETMRLTVSGTMHNYTVRGREDFNYVMLPHYELVLQRSEADR